MLPRKVGGNILPPVLTHHKDPSLTKEAKKAKVDGHVLVHLWVGTDGLPSHITLLKSLGYGLDENALETVSQYRFKPATENGVPVAVQLYVDVEFRDN